MNTNLIDPAIVDAFLDKPAPLLAAWKEANGQKPDGTEPEEPYNASEKAFVRNELTRLYNELSSGRTVPAERDKTFILTAGAPASGKTTLLGQLLQSDKLLQNAVYLDPDETILKNMQPYRDALKKYPDPKIALAMAYTKWRWASNYINGALMNKASADGHHILHGTTGTSDAVATLYDNVKAAGYATKAIIVGADEQVRLDSSHRRYRVEGDRFTPDEDVRAKGKLFPQRLPVHFAKADDLDVYWRVKTDQNAFLAMKGRQGKLEIVDLQAAEDFIADLERSRGAGSWKQLLDLYTGRTANKPGILKP